MTETQVKPLSSYFDEIVESCAKDCELGVGYYDYDCYDSRSNSIYFENEEYMIEGSFDACCRPHRRRRWLLAASNYNHKECECKCNGTYRFQV